MYVYEIHIFLDHVTFLFQVTQVKNTVEIIIQINSGQSLILIYVYQIKKQNIAINEKENPKTKKK